LLSGGVAGTVASCLTNPLEVVKTQLQQSNLPPDMHNPAEVARRILKQDGLSGFFRGLPPTLIGIIPSRSAYFYAYQRAKTFLGNHQRVFHMPEGSPPNALVAGFLAGIAGNTLTNPIWMVRTRMQLNADAAVGQQLYRGYGDVISSIWKQEGIGGFYKGILASYWGCTEGAAQFLLYEQFKTRLLKRENAKRASVGLPPTSDLSRAQYFWSAALAKMLASMATYPHEVARTRLREQARSGIFKYHGMWQTLSLIAAEEGTKSLYAGLGVHLMKVVPNSAFMFLTYEIVRKWLSEYTIVEEDNAGKSLQPPLVAMRNSRRRIAAQ
jgi:solute carrier family 25, member 33/36